MSMELQTAGNPRKWRFTWEAQSHIPILRLFLFDSCTKPSTQCRKLTVHITPAVSLVLVSWAEDAQEVSLRVPMPRVLVDAESPVSFSALDDHIEVKLVLLLPVDHPIVLSFRSLLSLDGGEEKALEGELKPLSLASEVKSLSSSGVHFYCRNCSFKLTASPLSQFVEMPSVNWREVADNWFGACCCSFGGISEKLVVRYANSYACAKGVCLVNSTNITLCKDDLVGFEFPDLGECQRYDSESDGSGDNGFTESELNLGSNLTCNEDFAAESRSEVANDESNSEDAPHLCSGSVCSIKNASTPGCCNHMGSHVQNYDGDSCRLRFSEISLEDQKPTKSTEILKNHESFLNGALVDGGVRLFKCNVSTGLPVGEPADIFRKYTLESMFANQLLECAKDELSFRTVVSDLKSRSPMVQIVLMNTNSWSGTGHCLAREGNKEPVPKIDLHPVIKVLFSQCSSSTESQARMLEDSVTKDVVDEVFMLTHQIEELIETLSARKDMLPPSCSSLQGLSLSSMPR
ncbi:hypothetical protein ACFX1Z_018456 [Malus domestica]